MVPYKNRSGTSGVAEYEIQEDSIKVRFHPSRSIYVYNNIHPGVFHVQQMKRLALQGLGLGTYINENIGKNYARKERSVP